VTCQLTFLPVGNADSIVIQTDSSIVIVDLGNLNVLEEWLEKHEISKIDRIYITHAHGDHFPSLIRLANFIATWNGKIAIEKIHLPYEVIKAARMKILTNKNNPKNGSLDLALQRIKEWSDSSTIKFSPIVRDDEYFEGSLKIKALHPSHYYVENHLAMSGSKLNEISTVLRISYGDFSAILLADIEGAGITELLNFLRQHPLEATASIVKIPHHGAYPLNGNEFEDLLALIDAEIAILSVGSKNPYGHVIPDLFTALIDLQNNTNQRLNQFICTEVTRTCHYSKSDRLNMGKSGLPTPEKCAGEITISANVSGQWQSKTEIANHARKIISLPYAACDGRADI
jgi:beta-lactamase superfamily II metal-dependent hydrolase